MGDGKRIDKWRGGGNPLEKRELKSRIKSAAKQIILQHQSEFSIDWAVSVAVGGEGRLKSQAKGCGRRPKGQQVPREICGRCSRDLNATLVRRKKISLCKWNRFHGDRPVERFAPRARLNDNRFLRPIDPFFQRRQTAGKSLTDLTGTLHRRRIDRGKRIEIDIQIESRRRIGITRYTIEWKANREQESIQNKEIDWTKEKASRMNRIPRKLSSNQRLIPKSMSVEVESVNNVLHFRFSGTAGYRNSAGGSALTYISKTYKMNYRFSLQTSSVVVVVAAVVVVTEIIFFFELIQTLIHPFVPYRWQSIRFFYSTAIGQLIRSSPVISCCDDHGISRNPPHINVHLKKNPESHPGESLRIPQGGSHGEPRKFPSWNFKKILSKRKLLKNP